MNSEKSASSNAPESRVIPHGWHKKSLGELVTFQRGYDLPLNQVVPGPYPVVTSHGTSAYNDEYKVEGPGVVLGRSGTVGEPQFINSKYYWPHNTTLFSKEFHNSDPKFIYYLIKSMTLNSYNSGSAVPTLNRNYIHPIEVVVPQRLSEQVFIAKILSTLDSKIELNQQMNQTLESIAQALFKHWFIDFEFPDENGQPYKSSGGEMVDSELGEIPKGWRLGRIGEEVKTVLGGTPSTKNKNYWLNGTVPWINSGKINEFRIIEPSEYITEEAVMESATKLMPKGTVALAITGATLGQISRLEIDACANQSVVGVIPTEFFNSEYLYFAIQFNLDRLISNQTGGAQQHINKGNVDDLEIIVPKEDIINKYKAVSIPIFESISKRCFEIYTLSKLKDKILPKLISGRIRVPLEDANV